MWMEMEGLQPPCVYDLLNDEDRELINARYSELEFLENDSSVKEVKCVNCAKVAVAHFISNCNHIFCKKCKENTNLSPSQCPRCQTTLEEIVKQDVRVSLKVYGLKTSCPNKQYGCREITTLFETPVHLKSCKYVKDNKENSENDTVACIKALEEKLNAAIEQSHIFKNQLQVATEEVEIQKLNNISTRLENVELSLKSIQSNVNVEVNRINVTNNSETEINQQTTSINENIKMSYEKIQVDVNTVVQKQNEIDVSINEIQNEILHIKNVEENHYNQIKADLTVIIGILNELKITCDNSCRPMPMPTPLPPGPWPPGPRTCYPHHQRGRRC